MSTEAKEMKKVLIFGGKTGWIGGMMGDLVKKEGTQKGSEKLKGSRANARGQ